MAQVENTNQRAIKFPTSTRPDSPALAAASSLRSRHSDHQMKAITGNTKQVQTECKGS